MLALSLDGVDALNAQLQAYPDALAARLAAKAETLANALVEKIRDEKLAGQVLKARSGALAASIGAEIDASGETLKASVGSFGDVKYAAIQEYGGRTAAHEILPAKAQALAFVMSGAMRFARVVNHPGSTIPERAYLRSSLDEMSDEIVAELTDAAGAAWEDA